MWSGHEYEARILDFGSVQSSSNLAATEALKTFDDIWFVRSLLAFALNRCRCLCRQFHQAVSLFPRLNVPFRGSEVDIDIRTYYTSIIA
jgi:hypothetical protein